MVMAAAAALAAPGVAQRSPTASPGTVIGPAVDASKLDVAGVALGMSRQQAAAAATAASYRCQVIATDDSYGEAMTIAVMERRGRSSNPFRERSGVKMLRCEGSAGSTLDIEFGQVPAGQAVTRVTLAIDQRRMDAAAVTQRALAKYGRRSIAHGEWSAWCVPEARAMSVTRQCEASRPSLTLGGLGGFNLNLSEGEAATGAREAAFKAETERRAPASTRPSF